MSFSLKELYESAEERISNPFVGSFLLSFFAINWEITFTLFFGDDSYYQQVYTGSRYLFLKKQFENANYLLPLTIAVLFPVVKILLNLFLVFCSTLANKLELKIVADKGISTNLYLKLRDSYAEKIQKIQDLISSESVTSENNKKLQTDLHSKEAALESTGEKVKVLEGKLSILKNYDMIEGKFEASYVDTNETVIVHFQNGYAIVKIEENIKQDYRLHNFYYDSHNNFISFVRILEDGNGILNYTKIVVCEYKIKDHNSFSGYENDVKVDYNRS